MEVMNQNVTLTSNNAVSVTDAVAFKKVLKKSRSNAMIERNAVGKRGRFVVKESVLAKNIEKSKNDIVIKKPRPPRRKFVSKVLQILNKATLGTQYPSQSDEKIVKEKGKKKAKGKMAKKGNNNNRVPDEDKDCGDRKVCKRTPREYRNINKSVQELIVLRSKKDIVQTPSENSYQMMQSDSYKWAEEGLLKMHKKMSEIEAYNLRRNSKTDSDINIDNVMLDDDSIIKFTNNSNSKLNNAIGNNLMISDSNKTLTEIDKNLNKPDMYKFFVNVLENSYNVYTVNTDPPKNIDAPNNEVIKQKTVKIQDLPEESYKQEVINNKSDTIFYIPDENEVSFDTDIINSNPSPMYYTNDLPRPRKKTYRAKHKLKSIDNNDQINVIARSCLDYRQIKKKDRVLARRQKVLEVLKEQLSAPITREPRNIHEALRIIARNKRKSVHFIEPKLKDIMDDDDDVCGSGGARFWEDSNLNYYDLY